MRVYVAGPYSHTAQGETADIIEALANMRRGFRAAKELLLRGHAPFCPWLDYQLFLTLEEGEHVNYQRITAYNMVWLTLCDAILLIKGWEGSRGAKLELEYAQRLGLKIYYKLEDVPEVTE